MRATSKNMMTNSDIAQLIGRGRQQLEAVVRGEKNFSYKFAKRATEVLGGTIHVWQDISYTKARQELLNTFKHGRGNDTR